MLGFEVVGSRLLDGLASRDLIRIVEVGNEGAIAVIAVEVLIADRMGQYASGSAHEMLGQAQARRGGPILAHRSVFRRSQWPTLLPPQSSRWAKIGSVTVVQITGTVLQRVDLLYMERRHTAHASQEGPP